MIPTMELCETKKNSINLNSPKETRSYNSLNKEKVLCIHCKRTASNGIRCLGMCVADNDY